MDISPRFYTVNICILHIRECSMVPANSCQAMKRIFLLGDDIHYESIIFRRFAAGEVRQVAVDDTRARELGMRMTGVIRAGRGYGKDRTMKKKCDGCARIVKGNQPVTREDGRCFGLA
jgi:hypothetical protein